MLRRRLPRVRSLRFAFEQRHECHLLVQAMVTMRALFELLHPQHLSTSCDNDLSHVAIITSYMMKNDDEDKLKFKTMLGC